MASTFLASTRIFSAGAATLFAVGFALRAVRAFAGTEGARAEVAPDLLFVVLSPVFAIFAVAAPCRTALFAARAGLVALLEAAGRERDFSRVADVVLAAVLAAVPALVFELVLAAVFAATFAAPFAALLAFDLLTVAPVAEAVRVAASAAVLARAAFALREVEVLFFASRERAGAPALADLLVFSFLLADGIRKILLSRPAVETGRISQTALLFPARHPPNRA